MLTLKNKEMTNDNDLVWTLKHLFANDDPDPDDDELWDEASRAEELEDERRSYKAYGD